MTTDSGRGPMPGPMDGGVHLMLSDRLALTAAYDLLFQQVRNCRDEGLRSLLIGIPPGRAAVAGVAALAGFVAFFGQEREETAMSEQFGEVIRAALQAGSGYPDVP